ncbi:MAG: hypothetical protein WCI02_16865 [Planctomycetota bacterium]
MNSRSNQQPETIANVLRLLPAKWAIALIIAVIAYVLLQPRVNDWFGWHLPSIPAMMGQEEGTPSKSSAKNDKKASSSTRRTDKESSTSPPSSSDNKSSKSDLGARPSAGSKTSSPNSPSANDLKFGVLKPIGRERYESPAGLIYGPGSEEGHRLEHIQRHLTDQPARPGSHGVFEGDMTAFLIAIDDAYKRARGHAKGTKQREEEGAIVYEAPFDRAIGFMGGSEGKRRGNPKLNRLRIVVRDRNLITAFPTQ